MDEGFSGIFNFIETKSDLVDGDEKLELILDFNQVITVVAGGSGVLGGINTAGHHDSKGYKVLHNLVDDVANTVLARV